MKRLKSLFELVKTVRNWFSVLLLYIKIKRNVIITFRNGIEVEIPSRSQIHIIYYLKEISLCSHLLHKQDNTYKLVLGDKEVVVQPNNDDSIYKAYKFSRLYRELNIRFFRQNFCEFYFKGKKVTYSFDPKDFASIINLYDTFIGDPYRALNISGKVVADIGASYGDTAIYFALRGARKVYAYEPIPWVFEILERNIRLNSLSDIVEVYPYAVASNEGKGLFAVPKNSTWDASLYDDYILKPANKDTEVTYIPVQKVIPPTEVDIAKIDCEGCEYDIILRWLKKGMYDEIILEYHRGYEPLAKKLSEVGYRIKFLTKQSSELGLLYAYTRTGMMPKK